MKKEKIKPTIRSIGVLCSGGDAPGMNAAVRAVVRAGIYHGLEVYGIFKGYSGLLEGHIERLTLRSVANIIQRGGTIIKTDRCKAFFDPKTRAEAVNILRRNKIDALIVIGGEGSFSGAHLMAQENDYKVIGIPGTIDNDVFGSEYTIGFDTAVNTALDAIDKIRDTASSHDRVFLVEVMGRTSAEIAVRVGLSGGAESIIVPDAEEPKSKAAAQKATKKLATKLVTSLQRSAKLGKTSSIVVVAEGAKAGSAIQLGREIKAQTKIDPKVAILGHIQRGGSPSAMDRYMASLMGADAVLAALEGEYSVAIGIVDGKLTRIPMKKIMARHKKVDKSLLKLAEILAS